MRTMSSPGRITIEDGGEREACPKVPKISTKEDQVSPPTPNFSFLFVPSSFLLALRLSVLFWPTFFAPGFLV